MEFLYWFVGSSVYMGFTGAFFRVIADHTTNPDNPWETPGPLLGGLAWPLALPFMAGAALHSNFSPTHRDTRRRTRELAEAEHQAVLAKQRRLADEELDRQLKELDR